MHIHLPTPNHTHHQGSLLANSVTLRKSIKNVTTSTVHTNTTLPTKIIIVRGTLFPQFSNETKNLGPCQRLWHSCLSGVDFSSQQPCRAKFSGHFDSQFRIYSHFKVFSKNFQRPLSFFRFFTHLVSREIYLLLQLLRYRDEDCAIIHTTKLSTKRWEQMFKFLPQILQSPPKSKEIEKK